LDSCSLEEEEGRRRRGSPNLTKKGVCGVISLRGGVILPAKIHRLLVVSIENSTIAGSRFGAVVPLSPTWFTGCAVVHDISGITRMIQ
jgi:hypothetical protein